MTNVLFLVALLSAFVPDYTDAQKPRCQEGESVTFEKVVGYRVIVATEQVFQVSQYRETKPITEHCVGQCRSDPRCYAVIVEQRSANCVGVAESVTLKLRADNDVSTFIKTCAKVPPNCKKKLWTVERSPGYNLIAPESLMSLMDNTTYRDCLKRLFQDQGGKTARSAQFVDYASKVDYRPEGNEIVLSAGLGSCILNSQNKFTEPESFRVTNFDGFYVENQCVDDFPARIERCSYEEYYNQTLKHYDRIISNSSTVACKDSCETEENFVCRGFTTITNIGKEDDKLMAMNKTCFLHSEDILTLGSWLLSRKQNAIYYRRVACLNMTVECGSDAMLVRYFPRSPFRGRLYVSGRAEKCGVSGAASGPTVLRVPFDADCGLNSAYAMGAKGEANRTLVYVMVVVQNNPIVQAQGDRFIRIGCVVGGSTKYNISASLQLGVESSVAPGGSLETGELPPSSALFNTTGNLPRVVMYIVDDPEDSSLGVDQHPSNSGSVALGEGLELRIEVTPEKDDSIDIRAYHLVASSQMGDSSILLLDNLGCPTGQVDFPQFRRFVDNDTVRLSARFKAFRFPSSNVVKFNVMVQFCRDECKEVPCPRTYKSSRPVRSVNEMNETSSEAGSDDFSVEVFDGAKVLQNAPNEPEKKNAEIVIASSSQRDMFTDMCKDMMAAPGKKIPLEVSFVVASGNTVTADSLVYGENKDKILIAGVEDPFSNHNMICFHEVLFIAISLVWLLIQIIILIGCLIVIRRYRTFAEDNHRKDYHSFDNLGFDSFSTHRRVHWPDQNVDVLHIN